jgi:transposase InsO family protein
VVPIEVAQYVRGLVRRGSRCRCCCAPIASGTRGSGIAGRRRCTTASTASRISSGAVDAWQIKPGTLTLGTDNGSAFTARQFKLVLSDLEVAHRRGGYRDPESQAFIES